MAARFFSHEAHNDGDSNSHPNAVVLIFQPTLLCLQQPEDGDRYNQTATGTQPTLTVFPSPHTHPFPLRYTFSLSMFYTLLCSLSMFYTLFYFLCFIPPYACSDPPLFLQQGSYVASLCIKWAPASTQTSHPLNLNPPEPSPDFHPHTFKTTSHPSFLIAQKEMHSVCFRAHPPFACSKGRTSHL